MTPEPCLARIAKQARSELASWEADFRPLLTERFGEATVHLLCADIRRRFDELLCRMPDPGWRAPQMRVFSLTGAIYIAHYLALKEHGQTADQVWALCEQATRRRFLRMRILSRKVMSWAMFSAPWKWLARKLALRSRGRPVGGWRMEYVPRETGFDYGVTYTRCAILQLAKEVGASEFAPFICQADTVGSEIFGWGLRRTETLAQGATRCDFRFRRGAATEVRFRLPVLS